LANGASAGNRNLAAVKSAKRPGGHGFLAGKWASVVCTVQYYYF